MIEIINEKQLNELSELFWWHMWQMRVYGEDRGSAAVDGRKLRAAKALGLVERPTPYLWRLTESGLDFIKPRYIPQKPYAQKYQNKKYLGNVREFFNDLTVLSQISQHHAEGVNAVYHRAVVGRMDALVALRSN